MLVLYSFGLYRLNLSFASLYIALAQSFDTFLKLSCLFISYLSYQTITLLFLSSVWMRICLFDVIYLLRAV